MAHRAPTETVRLLRADARRPRFERFHTHTETHSAPILKSVSSVELIYLGRIHDRTPISFIFQFFSSF